MSLKNSPMRAAATTQIADLLHAGHFSKDTADMAAESSSILATAQAMLLYHEIPTKRRTRCRRDQMLQTADIGPRE